MVRLSISESITLCRRVFSALPFPPGSGIELANAVVWLAAARAVPLRYFAELLPHLQSASSEPFSLEVSAAVRSYRIEDPTLLHLLEVIDCLTSSAIRFQGRYIAVIAGCYYSSLLLPLALSRSQLGVSFKLDISALSIVIESGELWANMDPMAEEIWQKPEECTITGVSGGSESDRASFDRGGLSHHFSQEDLRTRSSQRIAIDKESYKLLKQKAAEAFVPNSDISRRSGAGAEVDDSN